MPPPADPVGQSKSKRKNISMDSKTWKRLKTFGKFGESFDDILNRLMDATEEYQRALNSFAEPAAVHKLKPEQPQQDEKLGVENVALNPGVVSSRVAGSAAMTLDKGLEKRFLESLNEDIENAKTKDLYIYPVTDNKGDLVLYLPRLRFPIDKNELADYAKNLGGEAGNLLLLILEKIPDPNKIYSSDVLKQDIVQTINNDPDLSILNKHFGQIIGCTLFMPYKGNLRIGIREASEIEMRKEKEQSQPSQRQSQQPQQPGSRQQLEPPQSKQEQPKSPNASVNPKYHLREADNSDFAYKAIPINIRVNVPGIKFLASRDEIIQSAEAANSDGVVDIIKKIPDRKYKSTADIEDALFQANIGTTIEMYRMRKGDNKTAEVIYRRIGRITVDIRDIRKNKRELQKQIQEQEKQLNHGSINFAKT